MFGDRPTVLAVQTRHHPEHQPGSVPQRLVAAESGSDPIDQRAELSPPSVRIYPVSRDHRGDLVVPHKQRILARWPPTTPTDTLRSAKTNQIATCAAKITNYGCSTNRELRGREP